MTQLRPAKEADRELLRNMFNLMHAELAPFTRELHSVDERGYFEPAAADAYLAGEDCARAHVILEEGRTAGIVAMTARRMPSRGAITACRRYTYCPTCAGRA